MFIYKITNTINGKIYVGKTKWPLDKRWRKHLDDAKKESNNYKFYRAIRKYGPDPWIKEIIDIVEDNGVSTEIAWIKHFNSMNEGYNSTAGGEGHHWFLEEERQKRSNRIKGDKNYFYGKKYSGEKNGNYGRKHTDEEKKRMSETKKANYKVRYHWNNGITSIMSEFPPDETWIKGRLSSHKRGLKIGQSHMSNPTLPTSIN